MSVLERAALEQSPLADLHTIASELSIDGYRRLRKEQLIDAILERQGDGPAPSEDDEEPAKSRRRRGRRGGRGRAGAAAGAEDRESEEEQPDEDAQEQAAPPAEEEEESSGDEVVEGDVELLPNGSAFLRVSPPEASDDDVYISAAQVKRCELISGDRVTGPRRAPRRSERFASLHRIDTVNGRPAAELADGARFEDLPAAFPQDRFKLGSEDPTIKAIEWLTPIGKGSRVTIAGPARAGKTEALRRLAAELAKQDGVQLFVVLAGVRPEEISAWQADGVEPARAVSFAAPPDVQGQAVSSVVDQARRIAARGADAIVLLDTLDGLHLHTARKALGAARNIVDGGSLTVIATAAEPVGGETTVIVLDAALTSMGRFPAVDILASGAIHPELLVGQAGAVVIEQARREAAGADEGDQ